MIPPTIEKDLQEIKTIIQSEALERLRLAMGRLYEKIDSLVESRDAWKAKYHQLKESLKLTPYKTK